MTERSPPAPSLAARGADTVVLLAAFIVGALLLVIGAATGFAPECAPPGCTHAENCTVLADCLNGPTPLGLAAELAGVVCIGGSILVAIVLAVDRRRARRI
jgi:hypothetical protein